MSPEPVALKLSGSWSTQLRFTQAIGRALADLMPINATIVVSAGRNALENGELDVAYSKSVNNEHAYTGKGIYAGKSPATWLRTIAWLPQEDRFLFAVAPSVGVDSYQELAKKRPPLKMVGRSTPFVLKAYGFSYEDIEGWGGKVAPGMQHTWREAKKRYEAGELDAFCGDGSAFDFGAWRFVASRGYRFLGIDEDVMASMEQELGIRRIVTPAGFLPGIDHNLITVDDSHIVVTVRENLDDTVAYNLAKAINENRREIETCSIQVSYTEDETLPLTRPSYWSSLTGSIDRQWDERILGAPLHPGAARYYKEAGLL